MREDGGEIGGERMGCDAPLDSNRTLTLIGKEDKDVFSFQNNTRSKEHSKTLIHTTNYRQDRRETETPGEMRTQEGTHRSTAGIYTG